MRRISPTLGAEYWTALCSAPSHGFRRDLLGKYVTYVNGLQLAASPAECPAARS